VTPVPVLNDAHRRVFQPGRLTVGLMTSASSASSVEARPDRTSDVGEALDLAALADRLGFAALSPDVDERAAVLAATGASRCGPRQRDACR